MEPMNPRVERASVRSVADGVRRATGTRTAPEAIAEPFRTSIAVATDAWGALLGPRLRSLVLFGSVARGEAGPRSDIDLLVVAEGFRAAWPNAGALCLRRGRAPAPGGRCRPSTGTS